MDILNTTDRDTWWDVAASCPYATFFHSPLWHQLICKTYDDKKDATIGAVCKNGARAILPLIETERLAKGTLRNLSSTFAGCFGGIVADGPLTAQEVESLYKTASRGRVGRLHINGNPLWQTQDNLLAPSLVAKAKEDFTQILELNEDIDTIISNFSKGHKSSLKKGVRMGVTVREAQDLNDYRAYYGAYEDSLRRWGEDATSEYPWKLFECGYHLSQEYPEHIRLWLAEVEQKVVAGAWVFYWNDHADWWHGAAYEEYFDHYPNNVLQTEIFRHSIEQGYRYYDFNPSGGHEGVTRFKGRFGAKKWPIKRWCYNSKLFGAASRIKELL